MTPVQNKCGDGRAYQAPASAFTFLTKQTIGVLHTIAELLDQLAEVLGGFDVRHRVDKRSAGQITSFVPPHTVSDYPDAGIRQLHTSIFVNLADQTDIGKAGGFPLERRIG